MKKSYPSAVERSFNSIHESMCFSVLFGDVRQSGFGFNYLSYADSSDGFSFDECSQSQGLYKSEYHDYKSLLKGFNRFACLVLKRASQKKLAHWNIDAGILRLHKFHRCEGDQVPELARRFQNHALIHLAVEDYFLTIYRKRDNVDFDYPVCLPDKISFSITANVGHKCSFTFNLFSICPLSQMMFNLCKGLSCEDLFAIIANKYSINTSQ
jgi:hypothetical protein